jgi:hypothetical protein
MSYYQSANLGRIALLSVALAGCQAQNTAPALRSVVEPTSPVLVLPSAQQRMLALETGITGSWAGSGRNNRLLGGEPYSVAGPSVALRQMDDRQRIINGQVRSTLTLRTRDQTVKSR